MAWTYPLGKDIVKLVSTEWLADNLQQKEMAILDVQPNIHDYIQEHIPGAIYLNEGLLRGYKGMLPAIWNPPEAIEPVFRHAGLNPDRPVVVYTGVGAFKKWGDGLEQTMFAYSLARYGHNQVYVLDGGLDKWKAERRPLSQDYPRIEVSDFTVKIREEFFIGYKAFQETKDNEDVVVLDARPPNIYQGQGPWPKPGHIPGAVNLPWASLMHDDNKALLKSEDEISEILNAHHVGPDKAIICSCGTGREATNEFLLFKFYLGYPKVKNHEGAFTEWSSYPDNPTVTGTNPR
jgi:thiosulfate/3-mercaptopyruvate sulfurtransferase